MILSTVVVLSQFLRLINQYLGKGSDLGLIFHMLVLILPSLISYITPITLFCAIIFVYQKMQNDNELIIFEGSGLSAYKLSIPTIALAFIITLCSYLTTLFIVPYVKRELQDTQNMFREQYISSILEEKVFNSVSKDITIYVDSQQADGSLKGIIVYDQRGVSPAIITSQLARIIPKQDALIIELFNGNRQTLNTQNQLENLYFDSSIINLNYNKIDDLNPVYAPEEMYINELIRNLSDNKNTVALYELHQRLSWPLLNLSLASIAIFFALSCNFNRHSKNTHIIFAGISGSATLLLNFILMSLIDKHSGYAVLLYVFMLYITFQFVYLLKLKSENKVLPLINMLNIGK